MKIRIHIKRVVALGIFLLLIACSREPAEIHYQSDECAWCRMMIMDDRFSSQMVTSTGKAIKFDSIECLVSYLEENAATTEGSKAWVSDFDHPGNWLEAEEAYFIESSEIRSPMGGYFLALASEEEARAHLQEYSGRAVRWDELLYIKETNPAER